MVVNSKQKGIIEPIRFSIQNHLRTARDQCGFELNNQALISRIKVATEELNAAYIELSKLFSTQKLFELEIKDNSVLQPEITVNIFGCEMNIYYAILNTIIHVNNEKKELLLNLGVDKNKVHNLFQKDNINKILLEIAKSFIDSSVKYGKEKFDNINNDNQDNINKLIKHFKHNFIENGILQDPLQSFIQPILETSVVTLTNCSENFNIDEYINNLINSQNQQNTNISDFNNQHQGVDDSQSPQPEVTEIEVIEINDFSKPSRCKISTNFIIGFCLFIITIAAFIFLLKNFRDFMNHEDVLKGGLLVTLFGFAIAIMVSIQVCWHSTERMLDQSSAIEMLLKQSNVSQDSDSNINLFKLVTTPFSAFDKVTINNCYNINGYNIKQ